MKPRQFLCIKLLNTFSEKELEGLNDIISCRYFNTDRYVSKLLAALKKYVLGKEIFEHDLQIKVYSAVFTDLPIPYETLEKKERSLLNAKMSILIRLAEQFLVIGNINNNKLKKHELLYDTLLERRQIRLFEKRMKVDRHSLDEQVKKDELHHYRQHTVERKKMEYLHQTGKLMAEDNLHEIVRQLDMYYVISKLSLYNTALSLKSVSSGKEYDWTKFKSGTNALLKNSQYAQHPIVQLFETCITLLEIRDNKSYLKLLSLLDQYAEVVPTYLLKSFYNTANVYCAGQITFGHLEYNKKMFDLMRIMHEKNLFIEGGFIQIGQIKNMVTLACRVEEYGWAGEILEYYKGFIPREVRKSIYNFNLGTIAFYEKNYEAAHDKFIQVNKINTTYDVNLRMLILKCLYEKEMHYNEYTMQAFRSAKKFFKDNKSLTAKSRKGYNNFIKILIRLYQLCYKINRTQKDIERIKEILAQQAVNSDKRWLLEKIDGLENDE